MKNSIKQLLLLSLMAICSIANVSAQFVPQRINYQGIARNADGTVVVTATLNLRVSILGGSPSSAPVYSEQFQVNTNQYGLFTFAIGHGTPLLGNFASINWANGGFWVKQEVDVANNNHYLLLSTSELMAVPYAFYAESAGNVGPTGADGVAGTNGVLGITGPTGPTGPYWTDQTGTFPDTAAIYTTCGINGAACATPTSYTLGTGTFTTLNSAVTPFSGRRYDGRHQYLFRASELLAAGMNCSAISSLSFNITAINSTQPYSNFSIKLACVNALDLATGFINSGTEVYTNPSYTAMLGANTFAFPAPYTWNGTDNLLVDICFDNTTLGPPTNDAVSYTTTTFTSVFGAYNAPDVDITDPCTTTTGFNSIFSSTTRPNIVFGACNITIPSLTSAYIGYLDGAVIGNPTGGYKGPGTLNAQAVYDDNVLLTDYVFDKYLDGKVRSEDENKHADFKMMSIPEMREYVKRERHLPSIKGRKVWEEKGAFSVGELSQQIWESVEINALYLSQLDKRMNALESKMNKRASSSKDAENK